MDLLYLIHNFELNNSWENKRKNGRREKDDGKKKIIENKEKRR